MISKDWIAPGRTALLLIDMQVDFGGADGAMAKAGYDIAAPRAAVAKAALLAEAARAHGIPCVFVRLITRKEDETSFLREWKARRGAGSPALCPEGARGADFIGPRPQGGEMVFSKKRHDGFAGTGLDAALRGEGIDTLVMTGLTTECCIAATARSAFERDYHVVLVPDATACYEPDLHRAALRALSLNCASLVSTKEVHGIWDV
jgi:nicotinamidase-related amidase